MFTENIKFEPYWWDKTPRPELPAAEVSGRVEVAVIGSGYTGLHAALVTARAGRSTVVFDAGDAGYGCSTRNGGQISTSVKPDIDSLARQHGQSKAYGIIKEGHNALEWIGEFVREEQIACDFRVCGRFHAAHNQKQFSKLVDQSRKPQVKGLEVPVRVVERSAQHDELGTDVYHGGVIFDNHAALDPGVYHSGLLNRVTSAGAQVIPHCAVSNIKPHGSGFIISTPNGELHAGEVVVATNGYTGTISPWQRRRVIPIGSYIIATEPLDEALMKKLMPNDRIYSDTRKVVYYYRASPDRSRILFGGRVSSGETNPAKSAPRLKADLNHLFPELKPIRLSHSWMGFVAYTFDELAHTGKHSGIHYAMGYCGSGVSMASYFGMKAGHKVLGLDVGKTAIDDIKFQTRPLYSGRPWFLPPVVSYYRMKDKLGR